MLTFGEKLKQARISKKLTQKQLSDKLDVSNTVISNWEKNINRPDVDILEVMCGILDIEPNSLFNVKNNDNSTYSLVEKKLVSDYRRLDAHGKKAVNVIMNVELEQITITSYQLKNTKYHITICQYLRERATRWTKNILKRLT